MPIREGKGWLRLLLCSWLVWGWSHAGEADQPPNFVVIFLDDSGWGDFGPFGQKNYPTPHVDRLAETGTSFHHFYVPQAVCSASRAALLTGCYPGRTRVFGAHPPNAKGLDPEFATLAEVLKPQGYRTAFFGKWHLGDRPETRPQARGFDETAGLMYSNDMWKFHPGNPEYWGRFPLRYWENGEITIERVTKRHQTQLTTWYTEKAVDFIRRQGDRPFFLYVPHSMPHVPLFCSDKFLGKSGVGLYGDVMMEIDWSVGQIVAALKAENLLQRTVILFTSDNGPWVSYGRRAGVTPFREAKGTMFDGGVRNACIVSYPPALAAGQVSTRAFCSLDVLPTFAALAQAELPENPVDGENVWDWIAGRPDARNPNRYYPLSNGSEFQGLLTGDGRWKLHRPHRYRTLLVAGENGLPGKYRQAEIGWSLFDLAADPYESQNVKARHPEVFTRLQSWAETHRQTFYPRQK